MKRIVYVVSDGTGITVETFAHSILSQFDMTFELERMPYIDSKEKAYKAVETITNDRKNGHRPIVFTTLVNQDLNQILIRAPALVLDMFQAFVMPLEKEFGVKSSHEIGRSHKNADTDAYKKRIEAINFSLEHDDGQTHRDLQKADLILIGVSRSGKTPTSLYLAMQYGIKATNYPLIPEDFERGELPTILKKYKTKLFGLSINPNRLSEIRNQRRPHSHYASHENCRYEVNNAEIMMKKEGIKCLSSTHKSIEEIATTILLELKLNKSTY